MHLFDGKNTNFGSPSDAEPIYSAMIRAYQKDAHLDITTRSEYIRTSPIIHTLQSAAIQWHSILHPRKKYNLSLPIVE